MLDIASIRAALDPKGLPLPKNSAALVKTAARAKTFSTEKGSSDLTIATAMLASHDCSERLSDLAELLHVPDETAPHHALLRQRGAYAVARHRSAAAQGVNVPIDGWSASWSAGEPLRNGEALRHHLDRPDEERELDEFTPPRAHVAALAVDLVTLSTMWLFGGSSSWPVARIDVEWERDRAAILTYPGYGA